MGKCQRVGGISNSSVAGQFDSPTTKLPNYSTMKLGFLIYGSLDTLSGGYMYDRMLVEYLRAQGDTVEVISLRWRNYAAHLTDNFTFKLPSDLDILIEDELNHPSLIRANRGPHPYPIVSLVHHLRCSEKPKAALPSENRVRILRNSRSSSLYVSSI